MLFEISDDLLKRHPTYVVGVVFVHGAPKPSSENVVSLQRALLKAAQTVSWRLGGAGLHGNPAVARWGQAFEAEGINPRTHMPSVAALAQRCLRGDYTRSINPAADIANLISLKHLVPVGAHDVDRLSGDMTVRLSGDGDTFTASAGDDTEDVPPDEPVYATGSDIRTRRWVWRQAERAMTTPESRTIVFPVDGFTDSTAEEVEAATRELALLAKAVLGGEVCYGSVNADRPSLSEDDSSLKRVNDIEEATALLQSLGTTEEGAESYPAPPGDESLSKWSLSDLLRRGILDGVNVEEELQQDLDSGRRLTIYQGFDPTSTSLHIGHYLSLRVLRWFQLNGHRVIFLFGDFTARIGDPTGQSAERRQLTREDVVANAQTWRNQISRVLDLGGENPIEIKWNGEWLDQLTLRDMIEISANVTVQQLIERDMFQERLTQQRPLHLHETLYPLLQGYDSVAMSVDAELGGRDQMFNMMVGRDLVRNYNGKTKHVLMTPLIPGLDGRKMSKSYGNTVDLIENPVDMFFKLTQVSDELLPMFLSVLTDTPDQEIDEVRSRLSSESNLQDARERFARMVTERLHGADDAERAQTEFTRVVDEGSMRQDVEEVLLKLSQEPLTILDVAVATGLATSRGDARRLIQQGGLEINDHRYTEPTLQLSPEDIEGAIIKMGKRGFVRMKVEPA
ncbi:MAG: tyrosine--tRNA ligase [Chloroflexi bacterium]|nr:tyrosine--tRNA ligase [Chloroflexota bacterium]